MGRRYRFENLRTDDVSIIGGIDVGRYFPTEIDLFKVRRVPLHVPVSLNVGDAQALHRAVEF